MILITKRLRIFPLVQQDCKLFLTEMEQLEEELDLRPNGQQLEEEALKKLRELYELGLRRPTEFIWHTSWQIVLRQINMAVGYANFHGAPNKSDEVSVGFSIYEPFRGHAYAQEAVCALCRWALLQPDVCAVTAETQRENFPAQRVLQQCGMRPVRERADSRLWQISEYKFEK